MIDDDDDEPFTGCPQETSISLLQITSYTDAVSALGPTGARPL